MIKPEWFMLGYVCKVGIILIFHPFDLVRNLLDITSWKTRNKSYIIQVSF